MIEARVKVGPLLKAENSGSDEDLQTKLTASTSKALENSEQKQVGWMHQATQLITLPPQPEPQQDLPLFTYIDDCAMDEQPARFQETIMVRKGYGSEGEAKAEEQINSG